jgi:hypothetical protein
MYRVEAARSAWKTLLASIGQARTCNAGCSNIWQVYTWYIPVIYLSSLKVASFVLGAGHMPRMCQLHAWSHVCWLFRDCIDCIKTPNLNSV